MPEPKPGDVIRGALGFYSPGAPGNEKYHAALAALAELEAALNRAEAAEAKVTSYQRLEAADQENLSRWVARAKQAEAQLARAREALRKVSGLLDYWSNEEWGAKYDSGASKCFRAVDEVVSRALEQGDKDA